MAKPTKIYWDSCAWIGLLNGEAGRKRELEIIYSNARSGKIELWTSTISIVEVRRLEDEKNDPKPLSQEKLKIIQGVFRQPFVKMIPLALDIADNARDILRSTVGLKKWQDAIHLSSALRWDTTIMHTYDNDDLLHLSAQFSCRGGDKLIICYPDETTDGPLFAQSNK